MRFLRSGRPKKVTCQAQQPALPPGTHCGGAANPNWPACLLRSGLTQGLHCHGLQTFPGNSPGMEGGRSSLRSRNANSIVLSGLYNYPRGLGSELTSIGLVHPHGAFVQTLRHRSLTLLSAALDAGCGPNAGRGRLTLNTHVTVSIPRALETSE